jgi:hypothetical protein
MRQAPPVWWGLFCLGGAGRVWSTNTRRGAKVAKHEDRSLEAFIKRERRLVNLDIADLQDRYDVRTARDLASRIEIKAVYSHPAWEEMIEWERLEAYLQRLTGWQAQLI